MSIDPKLLEIRKEVFMKAREKLGLSTKELGAMACLSTRQIEQIENGETSSFYSAQIKVTAAKKVARLLQLSDEDVFDHGTQVSEKLNISQTELPIAEAKLVKNSRDDAAKDAAEIKERVEKAPLSTAVIAEEKKEPITKVQAKETIFTGTAAKSKPQSQKKLFLWLSVLAAAVFAVINLQPLFFADKPEEIIVVKEEIIPPVEPAAAAPVEPAPAATVIAVAPVTAAPASVIASGTSGTCPAEEGIISYKPDAARKPADMVFVQTKSPQVICVVDASGKTQNKLLEPGVGVSFFGKPPFKVLTTGLSQVDVFFQGAKVRLSNLNTKTLILEASDVTLPSSERSDNQTRQP